MVSVSGRSDRWVGDGFLGWRELSWELLVNIHVCVNLRGSC